MDFAFTQEQNMLKDSVARFVKEEYDFDSRRKIVESESGISAENWKKFSELGWLSIPFPENQGGFGGSAVDLMILMEEFGKGLLSEAFVPTVLLFGGLISKSEKNSEFVDSIVESIIAGETHGGFAFLERQSRYEMFDVATRAERDGDKFLLNGEKTVVFNGDNANKLIVLARTSGAQSDEQGVTLFLVDSNAEGVDKTTFRLMDGQVAANVKFTNVEVQAESVVGTEDQAATLVKDVVNNVIVALCAEAVGIMEKLYTTTVEYTKIRKQFDVAIGSFQSLQHRMAEMFIDYEQTKSLLYRAVCSIDEGDDDVEKNVLALKVMVGRAGKKIGGEAIQMHGGMGVTDELDVGHYVKRLLMINTMFGDADYTQQKFAVVSKG